MARTFFVYILASDTRELYIGVTNDRLVYFEMTSDALSAIRREKRLKRLSRGRKLRLIEKVNPDWRDLAEM
jgi:predicted GIY-YIG superfamily endonuclease